MKLFDIHFYREAYPDVPRDEHNAVAHFVNYGQQERRLPSRDFFYNLYPNFNWNIYLQINRHQLRGINTETGAILHYHCHGVKEGLEYTRELISGQDIDINSITKINFEYDHNYDKLLELQNTKGDISNEVNNIHRFFGKADVYVNRIPVSILGGNPINGPYDINIVRGDCINRKDIPRPKFSCGCPYDSTADGMYCVTDSWVEATKDKKSLLYPHVYPAQLYDVINNLPKIVLPQEVRKSDYEWLPESEIVRLKQQHFPQNAFVVCVAGRIGINSYPKSLIQSIKLLREEGVDARILILSKLEISPHRLTEPLYNEITSYDWIKSFTVPKREVLNYYRMCDVLASTYRDYCNHIGGRNTIKEYLLCDKPILCSRGLEREKELGEHYFGLYDCETCNTVPPLSWTQEFLQNPMVYTSQYEKYFTKLDSTGVVKEVSQIKRILETVLKKELIITIFTYKRNDLLGNYLTQLTNQQYEDNYHIRVIDDDPDNTYNFNPGRGQRITYIKNIRNYSTKGFYKNYANAIRSVAHFTDKYLFSCDDILIKTAPDMFLTNIQKYWNSINDSSKVALTLWNDRESSWNPGTNAPYNEYVLKSNWQETLFYCDNKFIKKFRWFDSRFSLPKTLTSSGVPRYFSIENYNCNNGMYVIKNNIIDNIGMLDSKMNSCEFTARIERQYNKSYIKLLIVTSKNGLSFMREYIEHMRQLPYVDIVIDDRYELVSNINSQKHFNNRKYGPVLQSQLDKYNPDIIFCEWGNYLLYELANRKKAHQKLVCRMHRFDVHLITNWDVKWENVDMVICISQYFTNVLKRRTSDCNIVTINNYFDLPTSENISVHDKNPFHIGIIGIEQDRKRLDLALKILVQLRAVDSRFKLFSKGTDLHDDYTHLVEGIDKTNYFHEGHSSDTGIDVNQWVGKSTISHLLSVSDEESFHYSMVTAIETNCNYYITNWSEIAKTMWRSDNIYEDVSSVVKGILEFNTLDEQSKVAHLRENRRHCLNTFTLKNSEVFTNTILSQPGK